MGLLEQHKMVSGFIALFLLIAPTAPSFALDRATQAGFVPHKALYDVSLSSKKSSAKVANISGKMFYEWRPSCDAWISSHRFDMLYEYVELPAVRVKSDFSTHETFDGKTFNFTSQRKRADDSLLEELRGSAGDQSADFSIPENLSFDLPQGTLFPMAHTLSVFEKIKAGEKFYNTTIFDGSDKEGPVDVNSFIGKAAKYTPPKQHKQNIDQALVNNDSWNIRLAFFPYDSSDTSSDYEMSLIFHANGVVSDMIIEYSDFSVSQKLIAIEPLEGVCDPSE